MSKLAVSTHNQFRPTESEPGPPQTQPETQNAAQKLGSLPKLLFRGRRQQRRVWTGFIACQRCWCGRLVVLPDGRTAEIERVLRGMATVRIFHPYTRGLYRQAHLPTTALRLHKSPDAVLMGRRKHGVRECKSAKKSDACRKNAKNSARPGHRRRGRPRKNASDWQRFVLKTRNKMPSSLNMKSLLRWQREQQDELVACLRREAEANRNESTRTGAPGTGR